MNQVSYEIRTRRGKPVFKCDTLSRAKEEQAFAQKRVGIPMVIYKITQIEEELTDA